MNCLILRCLFLDIDECAVGPCGDNGASCEDLVNDFKCTCKPGFTGATCDESKNNLYTKVRCRFE